MENKNVGQNTGQELTPQEEIMLDKYRLSFNILEHEGNMIQQYNHLLRSLKAGYLDSKTIMTSYDYLDCWTTLKELYDFMRFNKIADMERRYKKDVEKLQEIMERYESLKEEVSFDDLKQSYNFIRKFISIAGYHEDIDNGRVGQVSLFQRKKTGTTEEWEV